MITWKVRADLRARGFSDAQIREMTPEQAHAHLASGNGAAPPVSADELQELCGRALEAVGRPAVEAVLKRLGIPHQIDLMTSEQKQALRAEIKQLLHGGD
jgi:hypothetical protein